MEYELGKKLDDINTSIKLLTERNQQILEITQEFIYNNYRQQEKEKREKQAEEWVDEEIAKAKDKKYKVKEKEIEE